MADFSRILSVLGVLLTFVLLIQLAFTGIGQEIGPHWSQPTELSATQSSATSEYVAIDVAGGPDGGTAAWVVQEAGTYRVQVADLRGVDGELRVGDTRTVATTTAELQSIDLARAGDRVAVVWERSETSEAVLAVDGETRVVSANDSVRVNNPTVTWVDGTAVVAYQEYAQDGGVWRGVLATVHEDSVAHSRFGSGMGPDSISPSIATGADGAVVAWVNSDEAEARTAPLQTGGEAFAVGEEQTIAQSRTVRTMSGKGQLAKVELSTAGSQMTLLWTDLGSVYVAPLDASGSPAAEPTSVGRGQNPAVGVGEGGDWLVTSVTSDRTSGSDVQYTLARGDALEQGPVSKLPSNAIKTGTAFAPAPVAVWTETGNGNRVLASAYQEAGDSSVATRLQANPMRFVFLGVTAIVLGAVMVPMMPWVVGPLLAGFFLTTRLALDALSGVLGPIAEAFGQDSSSAGVRRGVQGLPALVPAGAFLAANMVVLYALLGGTGDALAGVHFSNPIGVSVVAVVAAAVMTRLLGFESPWKIAGLYGYVQTVGLWVTAVPSFL